MFIRGPIPAASRLALATAVLVAPALAACSILDPPDLVVYNAQHKELLEEIVPDRSPVVPA